MKAAMWAIAVALCGAPCGASAQAVTYPDWIRLKDGVSMRCIIVSEDEENAVVELRDAPGVFVTIAKDQIEWLQGDPEWEWVRRARRGMLPQAAAEEPRRDARGADDRRDTE